LVPLPETAARMAEVLNAPERFGAVGLVDALLKLVREATSLDIVRADIKADMLPAHFFMNIRVVDEHGRQLGQGRNLGALKAQWGSQARGAFQALAALKLSDTVPAQPPKDSGTAQAGTAQGGKRQSSGDASVSRSGIGQAASGAASRAQGGASTQAHSAEQRYVAWTFGELPELLEIRKGAHSVIGFPALVDGGDAVTLEVFDEPQIAASKHRGGLVRLFALQLKEAIKYLEKNIPDLQKMGAAYMQVGKVDGSNAAGGTVEELKGHIIALALERAFLLDPLPTDAMAFQKRLDEGRGRLTLIANEVARMALTILLEYQNAARKIKDSKNAAAACEDASAQLQRLVSKRFLQATPWPRLQHLARYLQAITLRLDKYRADPARDAARLAELRPLEQRYWRLVAERKGAVDERMAEFRWLMEELRVSFFAQELRTPQPVSVKRLEKAWAQLDA
jgi:ATP-dependent helicase HrpA